MKVIILSSSRADYGILYPLIKELHNDELIDMKLIVFGTHNSKFYGNTINEIVSNKIPIYKVIDSLVLGDSPEVIADSIGLTYIKFSSIWKEEVDVIICLGDRYELFAAISASIPFNISVAHISGGEITKGAIDNIYRNSLTLIAKYHFASTEKYKQNIIRIKGTSEHVYNVGALNIDNLKQLKLLTKKEFKKQYEIDLSKPSILITYHPETVSYKKNYDNILQLIEAMKEIQYQQIITMPNADTLGTTIREKILTYASSETEKVKIIESFGIHGYLSCMKYCKFLLGNSSSGFVEASYFPKKVINIGKRQDGRITTSNIIHCPIERKAIIKAIQEIEKMKCTKTKIYGNGTAAKQIISILKKEFKINT